MNIRPRAVDMSRVWLQPGEHPAPKNWGHVPVGCSMEVCSYLGGEEWTSRPKRVAPFFVGLVRVFNDLMAPQARQQLKPLLWQFVGTNDEPNKTEVSDLARCYYLAETLHGIVPDALERAGCADLAYEVLSLPEIRSPRDALIVSHELRARRVRAWSRGHWQGQVIDRAMQFAGDMAMLDVNSDLGHTQAATRGAELLMDVVPAASQPHVIVSLCESLLQVNAA